jgi:hypothetical protein
MTFKKFCASSKYVQSTIIRIHGVQLMERKADQLTAILYQVDNFYVEAFYKDEAHTFSFLNCYADTNGISPYLEQIDINEVYTLL